MDLTLGDLMSIATAQVQGRTDVTPSEASKAVNLAYQDVATRLRYAALEDIALSSTTSAENRIALPSDFAFAINLSNTSTGNELDPADARWIDSQATALGEPLNYALYGTWVELWPSPDSSYSLQLRYGKQVTTLSASTSTPAIDSKWHQAIAFKAGEIVASWRNDTEAEVACRARYLSYMGSTPSDTAYRQRGLPMNARLAWKSR